MSENEYLCPLPDGHTVVSICVHKDEVYVATDKGVFRLNADGNLVQVMFVNTAHGIAMGT